MKEPRCIPPLEKNAPVYVAHCDTYDKEILYGIIKDSFAAIGFTDELIRGKKVMLKPNLVLAKKPEFAATTHPAFVEACVRLLDEMGAASITLAESPGGQFNSLNLSLVYRVCEMAPLASDKLKLNDDFTFRSVRSDGVKLKNFHVISAFCDADVIIDLCKLKSHSLTGMSCATKNLFGLIPGVEKFEMHSSFPEMPDFSEMLVDLSSYVCSNKTFVAICDGILSMEGNGPSHGEPKKTDLILVSRSPYALDVIAEHIIGCTGEVLHLNAAASRGLVERDHEKVPVLGLTDYPTFDFKKPDTSSGFLLKKLPSFAGGRIAKLFGAKPKITDKCVGCGKCAESCPKHTITIEKKHGKKRAVIHRENCIRCYCCQELCPIGAVGVKQNALIKIIH